MTPTGWPFRPVESRFCCGPGGWRRVETAPPFSLAELKRWLEAHHAEFIGLHIRFAKAHGQIQKRPDMPAVVAFVYPDEGPRRGEMHDAWLFVVIDANGTPHLPRAFHLRADERWHRQPQLEPLERKRVSVVGVGALGSPMADMLAKAGVGAQFFRPRHQPTRQPRSASA